ncbi:MAG: fluoride efflux transporter CrcB [Actinomycetota bacterium]
MGSGIGALLRYLVSGVIQKSTSGIFPAGTLAVNIIGALLIGFLWELFQNIIIPTNIRMFIFIGLFGAFTTFSTFSLETSNLIRKRKIFRH